MKQPWPQCLVQYLKSHPLSPALYCQTGEARSFKSQNAGHPVHESHCGVLIYNMDSPDNFNDLVLFPSLCTSLHASLWRRRRQRSASFTCIPPWPLCSLLSDIFNAMLLVIESGSRAYCSGSGVGTPCCKFIFLESMSRSICFSLPSCLHFPCRSQGHHTIAPQ